MFKEKNDVKNTSIFILMFYNFTTTYIVLLSHYLVSFLTPKKMAWLSFICQFMFKVHETKSRTHLDMFCIYTPPPNLPIQCCFDQSRLFHSFEMSKDPTPWSLITTFMAFVQLYIFFFNRLIIFTFTETTN